MPLPTLRLPPHGSQRTARGETWFGYSFVPGDLHPLPSASSPGAPETSPRGLPHRLGEFRWCAQFFYGKPARMGRSIVDWRSVYTDLHGPPAYRSEPDVGDEIAGGLLMIHSESQLNEETVPLKHRTPPCGNPRASGHDLPAVNTSSSAIQASFLRHDHPDAFVHIL